VSYNNILTLLYTLFFASVVFDPSNSLLQLKHELFIALIAWSCVRIALRPSMPLRTLLQISLVTAGIAVISASSLFYLLQTWGTDEQSARLGAYLSFASVLAIISFATSPNTALKSFLFVVTLQAFATIAVWLVVITVPTSWNVIVPFGYEKDFLWLNLREFGGMSYVQVFFKTSPYMIIALAFYSQRVVETRRRCSFRVICLSVACFTALIISGTRANMLAAVVIPIVFVAVSPSVKTSYKTGIIGAVSIMLACFIAYNSSVLHAMLDPYETSNNVKLSYFQDYYLIFQDTTTILFGQGVGAMHYFSSLGKPLLITEVTPLEILRQLGAICGLVYVIWLLVPLLYLGFGSKATFRWLAIGYAVYLLVSLSNYFLMSSTGIVLVSLCYGVSLQGHFTYSTRVRLPGAAAAQT
jgi:hypothetical protein